MTRNLRQVQGLLLLISCLVFAFIISIRVIECFQNKCINNISITQKNEDISDGSKGNKIFVNYDGKDTSSKNFQELKNSRRFQEARDKFQLSDTEFCADPEVLIYLNNQKLANAKSYTIAVAVPIKSKEPNEKDFALEILRGVAQAQDEINQESEKFYRKSLKVLIANDDYTATGQIAQLLVEDTNVLGVIGHGTSTSTKTATEIYKSAKNPEKRLVLISPSSTSTSINPINAKDNNEYFFRTIPNNKDQAEILTKYMLKLEITKAAIVWNSKDNNSISFKEELKKSINKGIDGRKGEIVLEHNLQEGFDSTAKFINQAKNKKVRALIFTSNYESQGDTLLQFTDKVNNAQQFYYLGGDTMYGQKILRDEFRNMVVAVAWHKSDNSPESTKFFKKANKLWCQTEVSDEKKKFNFYTAAAYDATMVFFRALKNTSNNKSTPTRQGIKENLEQYKSSQNSLPEVFIKGVTGSINFTDKGDTTTKSQLVRVCEIQENQEKKYVYKLEKLNNPNWDRNKCN